MKKNRHDKIIEIINSHVVETQEQLASLLSEAGYEVTQATVSRDIRQMKLTKMVLEDGRQKLSFLKQQPAVMDTDAGKNGRFLSVGIKRVFPGLDCTETALRFSAAFHGPSALFEQ